MATFDELLDKIRREKEGNTSKCGTRFEILMKRLFETDSIWKNQFKKVQIKGYQTGLKNQDLDNAGQSETNFSVSPIDNTICQTNVY